MNALENRNFVDQKTREVIEQIEQRIAIFAKQGTIVETWRTFGGRKLGPYFRLAFRDGGRQCSIYLGSSKERVRQVRAVLDSVRKPIKLSRQLQLVRANVLDELREHKKKWDRLLREHGLYRKGFEFRRWTERTSN